MSRRHLAAFAFCALAASTFAHAQNAPDRVCTRDGVSHLVPRRTELAALFARPDSALIETSTGRRAPMGPPEVLVAHKGTDGKIVITCVDNEAAAQRALDGTADDAARKKEQ